MLGTLIGAEEQTGIGGVIAQTIAELVQEMVVVLLIKRQAHLFARRLERLHTAFNHWNPNDGIRLAATVEALERLVVALLRHLIEEHTSEEWQEKLVTLFPTQVERQTDPNRTLNPIDLV
jgi:hypothetical protein